MSPTGGAPLLLDFGLELHLAREVEDGLLPAHPDEGFQAPLDRLLLGLEAGGNPRPL